MGKSVSILHDELGQVFGESSVPNLRTLQRWVANINAGTFTMEKGVSPGRPRGTRTSQLVRKVDDMLANDPRLLTWDLAELLNIDQKSVYRIVTEDLDLKHVCSVWVPAKLSDKNKKDRVTCCKRILKTVNQSQSGVYCVEDELWVNWDIIKSKQQNKTWIKKNGKRVRGAKSKNQNSPLKKRCFWWRLLVVLRDFQLQRYRRVLQSQANIWWTSTRLHVRDLTTSSTTESHSAT